MFDWIFFILADNKHMHKSLDEFEFRTDPTTDYAVPALERLKIELLCCGHSNSFIFDWVFLSLAGYMYEYSYKISNGFELQPDPTTNCEGSCHVASGKITKDL